MQAYRSSHILRGVRPDSEYTIAEIGWFPWIARQLPQIREPRP